MYKSRLQELCHQKQLSLPNYTFTKDGPDHNPRFRASVTVNGISFNTPDFCKSSKEAQNEAARVAFDHLTTPSTPPPPPPSPLLSGSLDARIKVNNNTPKNYELLESSQGHASTSLYTEEMQISFKNELQRYTQRRKLNLPVYEHVREGSLHALRFKATVTVDKQTFESPQVFNTLKEAENAAARVALTTLSTEAFQEDDPSFYKNLVQELAQKEGLSLPIYETVTNGPAHMPTFFSTVVIEGESFEGTGGKNKKLAEAYAAKVAWTRLNERRLKRLPASSRMSVQVQEDLEHAFSGLQSTVKIDSKQMFAPTRHENPVKEIAEEDCEDGSRNKTASHIKPNSAISEASRQVDKEANLSAKIVDSGNAKDDNLARLPQKPESLVATNKGATPSSNDSGYAFVTDIPVDRTMSKDRTPSSSSSQSEGSDQSFSLLGNRVRVYPRKPNMILPEGVTMLPFSDDMWVAVRYLDSCNHEDISV